MINTTNIFKQNFNQHVFQDIGKNYAWEISYKYGGQQIYVPKKADPGHHLKKNLSHRLYNWLLYHYAGERVYVCSLKKINNIKGGGEKVIK
jgi:hypothetical protein